MPLIESGIASFAAGLIGSVVNRVGDYHAAKLTHALEVKKMEDKVDERKHRLEVIRLDMESKSAGQQHDFILEELRQDSETLRGSYDSEAAIGATYPWVNAIRALVRPALTFGFAVALVFFPVPLAYEDALINLTVLCVSWYFGARVKTDYFPKK